MHKKPLPTLTSAAVLALTTAATLAQTGDDVYRAADGELDPRIEPAKVTEHEPPPLPDRITLPIPPDHCVAPDASSVPVSEAHWRKAIAAITRGAAYLGPQQHRTGAWLPGAAAAPTPPAGAAPAPTQPIDVAVTAFAVKALAQARPHVDAGDAIARGTSYLRFKRIPGVGYGAGPLTNYVTSAAVSALASVDEFEYADEIAESTAWLADRQWDQGEGLDPRQDWFGGAGYGNRGRPDLSNTQMMLEALYDAGVSPDEPAVQRALSFVSRTQNLSATNKAAWAGDDGGFVYTPANGGESFASEVAGEGRYGEIVSEGSSRSLRSYGSMTYAGFKSLLYAGLSPGDVRVRAAFDWVRRHWTFDENPGLGQQGLYYYYHAMSRALRVAQQHRITDVDGAEHNWREELIDAIATRQQPDGSWRNDADRWLEGEPVLATVYALLALEEALKPVAGFERAPE